MGRLLLLFLLVPAVELYLLIEIGERIGTLPTLGIIVATGVIGASLARRQGLAVLERLRTETGAGRVPADAIVDGVLILIAGALLVTPGVLTDAVGFCLLIPPVRALLKRSMRRRFERAVREGRANVHVRFGPGAGPADRAPPSGHGKVIDQDDVP